MAEGLPTLRKARYAKERGKVLGDGSYRIVYRTRGSKWVYKFNLDANSELGNNVHEWKTYQQYKSMDLPGGVKLPEMHYLNGGIIAAEYIDGKHPENACYRDWHSEECPGITECWSEKVKHVPVSDIHHQNVLITNSGDIYLIDLGHGDTFSSLVKRKEKRQRND